MKNPFDVTIKFAPQLAGTIDFFTPHSDEAVEWVDENVETDGWQWVGSSLAVHYRYSDDLIRGLLDAGLTVGDDAGNSVVEDEEDEYELVWQAAKAA